MIEDFDNLLVAADNLLGSTVELNLLNWQTVVVIQRVDGNWIAHIVKHHLAFFCANCNLQSLSGLKSNACNLLPFDTSWHFKVVHHLFLVLIPELYATISATNSTKTKLRAVINAIKFRTF